MSSICIKLFAKNTFFLYNILRFDDEKQCFYAYNSSYPMPADSDDLPAGSNIAILYDTFIKEWWWWKPAKVPIGKLFILIKAKPGTTP